MIIQRAEDILNRWKRELGPDERAYRNHVYRVVHFCSRFREGDAGDREKVVIAACDRNLHVCPAAPECLAREFQRETRAAR